ncbi:hypothetical protein ACLMJK_000983 [Lecanora helva]
MANTTTSTVAPTRPAPALAPPPSAGNMPKRNTGISFIGGPLAPAQPSAANDTPQRNAGIPPTEKASSLTKGKAKEIVEPKSPPREEGRGKRAKTVKETSPPASLPAPVRSGTIDRTGAKIMNPRPTVRTDQVIAPKTAVTIKEVPRPAPILKAGFTSSVNELKLDLITLSQKFLSAWHLLVGLYLQQSGRTPYQVGCSGGRGDWEPNHLRADILDKDSSQDLGQWKKPNGEPLFDEVLRRVQDGNELILEEVIHSWASTANPPTVHWILEKAGWRTGMDRSPEWHLVDDILKMENREERDKKIAQARAERPRFFQACEDDYLFCGVQNYKKRHISSVDDDPDYEYQSEYTVCALRVKGQTYRIESPKSPPKKRKIDFRMATGPGQPTQFHGVPLEERAIDSKGNRLPWSLEYHEDHPSARGQKRHPEEKGPFGKSMRRKGSTRTRTRTATPAKKENPTLDGFEQALKYEAKKAADAKEKANQSPRTQDDTNRASRHASSHTKEPTQIMIYGYPTSRQYAAISLYEKCSGGMICEDYEREPPAELHKYPNTFTASRSVHSRSLTKQEKALAFRYDGGEHWIKLTCESAESASQAVDISPINIYGHWVYAEYWNGKGPVSDLPIPITEEDRRRGPFNSPRPPPKASQTMGAAFAQNAGAQMRAANTLPRSFTPNTISQADSQPAQEISPVSSSTLSSATATGIGQPDLRNRHPPQTEQDQPPSNENEVAPGIPRYHFRPANEAFLPQPTWWERQVQWLRGHGLIPTDFIGDGLPILDNGDFDWARASWYWRMCFWIDSHIGTDICGLKDD